MKPLLMERGEDLFDLWLEGGVAGFCFAARGLILLVDAIVGAQIRRVDCRCFFTASGGDGIKHGSETYSLRC